MRRAADKGAATDSYAEFIRLQASDASRSRPRPSTLRGWDERLALVRAELGRSFGRMPEAPCPLEPEILGTLVRDGYAIERLTFQSRAGVRVTANLYRPEPIRERHPAVLSVHGHWPWARMDPHVQPRCIALAKLGYVVLGVDAFGAGERAIEPASGTYHGGLVGASLWPLGTPLIGLQVYDNRRAVDYLVSRPDVDPARLAITGASGGGNQSFYAGATDERLSAVIPVCGIGTFDAYLTTACCVCELFNGGAVHATTADLLAMVAPRALMVISATRDAFQFSVGEAAKSIALARERFRLLGQADKIRHVSIESGHDYSKPMREATYGWVEKWLRGRGDGSPVPEPEVTVEEIQSLRCYPDGASRPRTIVTIPEFATREGRGRLAALPEVPDHRERWNADAERMRATLRDRILGGFPPRVPLDEKRLPSPEGNIITIKTEPGIRSRGTVSGVGRKGTAFLVASGSKPGGMLDDDQRTELDKIRRECHEAQFATVELTTPRHLHNTDMAPVAGVADHTAAEWGLWVGRPLLGQWVWDIIRWLDLKGEGRPFILVGVGAMSLPAILAAALDSRVAGVACSDCLVSFVGQKAKPWSAVPMGLLAPDILDVGDIGHLAALVAPRPLVVSSGIEPEGEPATIERLSDAFAFTRGVYRLLGASAQLTFGKTVPVPSLVAQP